MSKEEFVEWHSKEDLDEVHKKGKYVVHDEEQECNDNADDDVENAESNDPATTSKKSAFPKVDGKFNKMYHNIVKRMWKAVHNPDFTLFEIFLIEIDEKHYEWDTINTDNFGRTIIHAAVEENNETLIRTLLHVGVDVNCVEGCGASPLT